MGKVTVIRPDGTPIEATEEQAARLEVLGYKRETPEAATERYEGASKEQLYSTPYQRALTGFEGFAAGTSLGITDFLQDERNTEESRARAEYNSGTRTAMEILGGLVPLAFSGGGTAAAEGAEVGLNLTRSTLATPAGLASTAGKALGNAVGGGRAGRVVGGAVEGGIFGGASAADHAFMDGDPVTAETVMHGIGWGTIFGAGLSAGAEALGAAGAAAKGRIAKRAAAAKEGTEEAWLAAGDAPFSRVQTAVAELRDQTAAAVASTDSLLDDMFRTGSFEGRKLTAEEAMSLGALKKSWNKAHKAIAGNDPVKAEEAINAFADELGLLKSNLDGTAAAQAAKNAEVMGLVGQQADVAGAGRLNPPVNRIAPPNMRPANRMANAAGPVARGVEAKAIPISNSPYEQAAADAFGMPLGGEHIDVANVVSQLREVGKMRAVTNALNSFPRSLESFRAMSAERAEAMFAGLEMGKSLQGFPMMSESVNEAIKGLSTHLGLAPDATARAVWKAAKEVQFGEAATKSGTPHNLLRQIVERAMGMAGFVAARKQGAGIVGSVATSVAVRGMTHTAGASIFSSAKANTIGRIDAAVASFAPKASRALSKAPATLPNALRIRLDGSRDSETDRKKLAAARMNEIREAAPNIRNTMYQALGDLDGIQPKLMPAVFKGSIDSFFGLVGLLPKDPGAQSGFKSTWAPSDVEIAKFEKSYATFHDPLGALETMLKTGRFDPATVQTLERCAPQALDRARYKTLEHISTPGVLDAVDYGGRVSLSLFLGLPLHSSMEPGQIATTQQMYVNRNNPLPTPAGGTNPGGRPAGENPSATAGQKATER